MQRLFEQKIKSIGVYVQKHKKLNVICLMMLVFVSYLLYGLQFNGPVFLSDEIGYLNKAIALSGGSIDAATSWQGGYSFLILPAFWLFSDPLMEWRAVLAINALMWAISAGLLVYVIKMIFPKKKDLTILSVVVLSLIYPGFISISGYAFASSGFVFVLMLALTALMKSGLNNLKYLSISSLLVGFLFWIHPIGATLVVATILILGIKSFVEKKYLKYILPITILIVTPLLYYFFIRPWFNDIMTPGEMSVFNHYDELSTDIISGVGRSSFWLEVPIFFLGQISYILISTFGMAAFCVDWLIRDYKKSKKQKFIDIINDTPRVAIAMIIFSIIVSAVIAAICFASNQDPSRADHWIYGRYSEMLILPVIAVGLLSEWRLKTVFYSIGTVFISGIILLIYTNSGNTLFDSLGRVNIQSFWPLLLTKNVNYLIWFVVGCAGILMIGLIGKKIENRRWLLLFVIPLMILTINDHNSWHIYRQNSSGLSEYYDLGNIISENYKKSSCMGLDPRDDDRNQRYRFYAFYLHRFEVVRMQPKEWLENCDGPYLTYDIGFVEDNSEVKPVAKESRSGLYVLMRKKDISSIDWPMSNRFIYYGDSRYGGCTIKGCLKWDFASKDLDITEVGEYTDNALKTTGRAGYLLYGPSVQLGNGKYHIKINGSFRNTDFDTRLTVTSNKGSKIYVSGVFDPETNNYDYIFKISKEVQDLEIRLFVTTDADISLYSYEVIRDL